MATCEARPLLSQHQPQETTKWTQHLAAILATLTSVAAGSVLGWTSPALPSLELSSDAASWVGSLAPLGALLGALPAGWLADKLGRRTLLLILGVPYLGGFGLLAVADLVDDDSVQLALLYLGRLVSGAATGASTLVLPLYCDEVAEDGIRGALGVYLDLNMTVGILLVYVLGAYLSVFWLSLACAAVPLLFLVTFPWMPESPRHLLAKGKMSEARCAMAFLRGAVDTRPEIAAMQKMVDDAARRLKRKSEGTPNVGLLENGVNGLRRPPPRCLSVASTDSQSRLPEPATRRAMCLVLGLMSVQQLCGINAIIFYTVDIFHDAGSSLSPWKATVVVGAVQVIASICSITVVDRLGRRFLLAMSCEFMAASLTTLALYFYFQSELGMVPVVALSVYIFFYSVGFGPLPWFMMAELLPVDVKKCGSAAAIATNYALVFAVTNSFQGVVLSIGMPWTCGLFAVVCLLGLVFVLTSVPETKGRSQEDIQALLRAGDLGR